MVDVLLQGAWVFYCINKDKGNESLTLLAFERHVVNAIFQNIQWKADYSGAIWEFELTPQMFAMVTQNINRCSMNTGVLITMSNI